MEEEPKITSKRDLGTSQKLPDEIFDQQISPKVLRHLEINEGKKMYINCFHFFGDHFQFYIGLKIFKPAILQPDWSIYIV